MDNTIPANIEAVLKKVADVVAVIKSEEVQAQMDAAVEHAQNAFDHLKDTATLTVNVTLALLQASGMIPKTRDLLADDRIDRILAEVTPK